MNFAHFFKQATGNSPFPFQEQFATSEQWPTLIHVPTGMGKTAMAILGWLWRRREDSGMASRTPRRLIYCLPMRVLVEQTYQLAERWLHNVGLLGPPGEGKVSLHLLMGGEIERDWDIYPEADVILVGTQDQLLSRALNRGYGMSRYRWPIHFGLLNSDCLWVMDEVQLMGSGLATTTQLQGFRNTFGTIGPAASVWMSATLNPSWFQTIDSPVDPDKVSTMQLSQSDLAIPAIKQRQRAAKRLVRARTVIGETKNLAEQVLDAHQPGSRTLVVLNTVGRAVALYQAILKCRPKGRLILGHSRFRPRDRQDIVKAMLEEPPEEGSLIVTTQIIEAGVDISARTLFTELAPWASLVQRFGRCNRKGEFADSVVYWIDGPTDESKADRLAAPYLAEELTKARQILADCQGVGPYFLPSKLFPRNPGHVLRRKDLLELFDTTPDLAGYDIDISRFIRESTDQDLQVFWRSFSGTGPEEDEPLPQNLELCSAPISEVRECIRKRTLFAWSWDYLEGKWTQVNSPNQVYPGRQLMLRANDGHYTPAVGWTAKPTGPVQPVLIERKCPTQIYGGDPLSETTWMTLADHTGQVVEWATYLVEAAALMEVWRKDLVDAARWHDAGKAHPVFQRSLRGKLVFN